MVVLRIYQPQILHVRVKVYLEVNLRVISRDSCRLRNFPIFFIDLRSVQIDCRSCRQDSFVNLPRVEWLLSISIS